jgi:hypothetical protein
LIEVFESAAESWIADSEKKFAVKPLSKSFQIAFIGSLGSEIGSFLLILLLQIAL